MVVELKGQKKIYRLYYVLLGSVSLVLLFYYLSNTLIHFTTDQQFPINSFYRYPLTGVIFVAELFSFMFAFYFIYTLFYDDYVEKKPQLRKNKDSDIAILLPIFHEPREIIERTLEHVKKLRWKGKVTIYLLDDSKETRYKKEMDQLAHKYKTRLIRRKKSSGYKAGNINNAVLRHVKEEFFAVLDSDQAPHPEFLEETMPYFEKDEVGFVQTPQHFINDTSTLSRAAKAGTDLFYRAQAPSKAKDGAITFCGTNLLVRKKAFVEVDGFAYYTATEDIDLGLRMNARGYRGSYVPKILVDGYAPESMESYKSQQYRWSNGNMAILRENFLRLIFGDFSLRYKVHMFFTLGWWLIGVVTLVYVLVPVMSITLSMQTHHTWLPNYMLGFLFFNLVLGIGIIHVSRKDRMPGEKVRLKDAFFEYSLIVNSMLLYSWAALNVGFRRYVGFIRTNKSKVLSDYSAIKWNLLIALILISLSFYSLYYAMISPDIFGIRTYLPLSLWLLFFGLIFLSSIFFVGEENEN